MRFGHASSCSVRDAIVELRKSQPDSVLIAVVRSLDSADSREDLSSILRFHGIPHECVHGNTCLAGLDLWRAVAEGVFTGFDEVWVFVGVPPEVNLDDVPASTSDVLSYAEGVPPPLLKVILDTRCLAVFADGCGLNYITADDVLARELASRAP